MDDKNVNAKTIRKQCRLSTNMLDDKDKERLRAAYHDGFTHAKINNNIRHSVVSRDMTNVFPLIEGVYPYGK